MKTHLLSLALLACAVAVFAQGPLNPPGAPGQTMKSLDQIEPRTVIPGGSTSYTITSPGSYVLGGNLTIAEGSAIVVNSGNVTLDLNGFTIASAPTFTFGSGIVIGDNLSNIRILNGYITGGTTYAAGTFTLSGFENGIFAAGNGGSRNVEVRSVTVTGVEQGGISLADGMVVDCRVRICGGNGISGVTLVTGCEVGTAGGQGINATVVNTSRAGSVGSLAANAGISAARITGSFGSAAAGRGIDAYDSAKDCTGYSTSNHGVSATIVSDCSGWSTSGIGISGGVVSFSFGNTTNGTTAINAFRSAIGCVAGTGAVTSPNKSLGTP